MISNFKEFLDYVMSFYGDADALYPIDGLTREEVALATLNYLDLCEEGTHVTWGNGDSLDRERVRDLIINTRATKPQLPVFHFINWHIMGSNSHTTHYNKRHSKTLFPFPICVKLK